jgi:hypothetical protein
MRVKIAYGVELDNVPEIVSELIDEEALCLSQVERNLDAVCSALKHEAPNMDYVLEKLDDTRRIVGSLDVRLNEMESLLGGFIEAKKHEDEEESDAPEPEPPRQAPPVVPTPVVVEVDDSEDDASQEVRSEKINEDGVYDYERPYEVAKESEK